MLRPKSNGVRYDGITELDDLLEALTGELT